MGLMLAEPGFHTRCWVEWEEYPRSVIIAGQRAGYFAPAPIWDDLTTFDARPFAGCIDTLLAGYPCQPFSHAGQRKGADDERHLWPDVARVARELGPGLEWLFLENVAGHITLGLETVLRDLWQMGFTPAAGAFSAAEVGASHERLRVFIVAYRDVRGREPFSGNSGVCRTHYGTGEPAEQFSAIVDPMAHRQGPDGRGEQQAGRTRSGGGRPSGSGAELGNAASTRREPARAGTSGECEGGQSLPRSGSCTMADTDGRDASTEGLQRSGEQRLYPEGGRFGGRGNGVSVADTGGARLEGREWSGASDKWLWPSPSGSTAERGRPLLHPPGPADMGRWADVLVTSPDLAPSASFGDLASFAGQVAAMAQAGLVAEAEIEPSLRRMADGLALRSRALRLLGNGVHPLAAGHAWRTLSAAHGLRPLDLVAAEGGHSNRANVISMIEAAE